MQGEPLIEDGNNKGKTEPVVVVVVVVVRVVVVVIVVVAVVVDVVTKVGNLKAGTVLETLGLNVVVRSTAGLMVEMLDCDWLSWELSSMPPSETWPEVDSSMVIPESGVSVEYWTVDKGGAVVFQASPRLTTACVELKSVSLTVSVPWVDTFGNMTGTWLTRWGISVVVDVT